jgi:hypothetical protein
MGWLQRGFILSYYYLLRYKQYQKPEHSERNFYHDAMRTIINEGGDTDTNAAIAGGMVGALVGFNSLP